jgi:hypothetical protein
MCTPGKFITTGAAGTCNDCPGGSCPLFWWSLDAYGCVAGHFQSNNGSQDCQPCSPGFRSASGSVQCQPCPVRNIPFLFPPLILSFQAGSFAPSTASVVCRLCSAGSYSAAPGSSSCQRKQQQFHEVGGSDSSLRSLRSGYLPTRAGARSLVIALCVLDVVAALILGFVLSRSPPCPLGKYSQYLGSLQCTECPVRLAVSLAYAAVPNLCKLRFTARLGCQFNGSHSMPVVPRWLLSGVTVFVRSRAALCKLWWC